MTTVSQTKPSPPNTTALTNRAQHTCCGFTYPSPFSADVGRQRSTRRCRRCHSQLFFRLEEQQVAPSLNAPTGAMADFCQATRDAFGDLIQKPPLTDDLLQRPPFKFLHDVITATIKASGFLDGQFTADELDASKIKDKDAKCAFLQKAIDSVSAATGSNLAAKPAKIVAGKDADKTNEFLQALANAAKKNSGSAGADNNLASSSGSSAGSNKENRITTNGHDADVTAVDPDKKSKEKRHKSKDKDKEKEKDKEKDKEKKHKEKDPDKKKSKDKTDADGKEKKERSKDKEHRSKEKEKDKEKEKEKKPRDKDGDKSKDKSSSKEKKHRSDSKSKEKTSKRKNKEESDIQFHDNAGPADRRSSNNDERTTVVARTAGRPTTSMGRPMTSMGRPGTAMARPAPPKLKRKELGEVDKKPMTELPAGETANIITTSAVISADAKDDADNFLVEEPVGPSIGDAFADQVDAEDLDANEHGGLVRKILETKKELESGLDDGSKDSKTTTVVFDEKEREKTRKEAQKIQDFIQKLTRSSHPLGRLLDYMQEDIDSMIKELEQWRSEYRTNMAKLRETYGNADSDIEPLRMRLNDLDNQIKETRDAISTTRANIIANEEKLRNLITSVGR